MGVECVRGDYCSLESVILWNLSMTDKQVYVWMQVRTKLSIQQLFSPRAIIILPTRTQFSVQTGRGSLQINGIYGNSLSASSV